MSRTRFAAAFRGQTRVDEGSHSATIEDVWDDYRRSRSSFAKQRLIGFYYARQVRRIAARLCASLPDVVDIDDLHQEGLIALAQAIERFQPERGIKFETFSSRRILGAMQDYLRRLDHISRPMREDARAMGRAIDDYRKRHGHAPSEEETRRALGLSERRFSLVAAGAPAPRAMYAAPAGGPGPNRHDEPLVNSLRDHRATNPVEAAVMEDLKGWITRGLSRRDRLIVMLYYTEELTMREVADVLGLSESRVSQEMKRIRDLVQHRVRRAQST